MKIAVIGATGRTGIPFIRAAVANGHQVNALVRNATRFPVDLAAHANVTLVIGDIGSTALLVTDSDAVLIAVAAPDVGPTTVATDAVKAVAAAVAQGGAPRLSTVLLVSSDGVGSNISKHPFVYRNIIHPYVLFYTYQDLENAEIELRLLSESHPSVQHVIFRPPQIFSMDPVRDIFVLETGQDDVAEIASFSNQITYGDFGPLILTTLEAGTFLNKNLLVNSKTKLAELFDPRGAAKAAVTQAAARYAPRILLSTAIAVALVAIVAIQVRRRL
ncbi:hypothetical protein HK100_008698 [Physocladia obscura]|uniref:NAD(P)-binding domain-containing protein n=1 Tax=Physocladia obscura TaxID=109957 RepID=A0AAD5T4K3_9FUNG|nr:hypothetical protein HK100_008698 [Physocladia obscura]